MPIFKAPLPVCAVKKARGYFFSVEEMNLFARHWPQMFAVIGRREGGDEFRRYRVAA